mmetsp:Transcript_27336/g.41361  ORF Transcript_27336/g.41361 Transcript_27336/m.41361 type:complete len:854 (-) Transcript_27336:1618-4179(-)
MKVVRFLSLTLSFLSSTAGILLLIFPKIVVSLLLANDSHNNSSHAGLVSLFARVSGGFFIVLSYATFIFPFVSASVSIHSTSRARNDVENANHQAENQKTNNIPYQVTLTCYALVGLLLVFAGLLNERFALVINGSKQSLILYEYFWGVGVFYLVLSCLGLMISFWPKKNNDGEQQNRSVNRNLAMRRYFCCFCYRMGLTSLQNGNSNQSDIDTRNDSLSEPLLRQEEGTVHELQRSNDDVHVNSRVKGTRRLMKLAAPQMMYLYIGCVVLLIRLPFSLSIPHFVSTTLGALARGDYQQAHTEILLLFLLGTVDAVLDFWCVFLFGIAKERIVRGVRIDLLAAILRQEISFFDENTTGDLSSRLSSDCGEMAGDLTWFFRFSIESVVRIVGIAIYMLLRCPILGGCALSIVPFVAVLNKLYGDWLSKNSIQVQTALAGANTVAQEAFSCIRTVIAFAAEDFEHDKYVSRINEHYCLNVKQLVMTGVYYMAISTFLINTVVQALLLLIGTNLIREGRLSSEILLAFMLYQGQLQNETMNLFNSYSSLIKSSGAGDKVFALLDRMPPPPGTGNGEMVVTPSTNRAQEEDNEMSERKLCTLSIRQAHFVYPSRPDHMVLENLNLTIPAGSNTALVGTSGCGKSTIVNLLQRFYDPTSGGVFLEDENLKSVDVKEHRRTIGVVTQDPVLFSGSILSNITYGCRSATTEDAINSAKLANAHNFISSFPDGYNTQVGERGVQLSGGQKQRIAIARAVVKNPSLLLLDEATSALDADSETVVQEALDDLLTTTNMTTVVVAHRLRTVRHADCIVYLDRGKVVEKGTHDELMKIIDGFYRRMVLRSGTDGKLDELPVQEDC